MAVPVPLRLLLLGVFAIPGGCAYPGPHSLRYFYTAVSEPGPGLPQFTVVGYLDDQLFFHFDSEGKGAQPRAPWIQAEGPEYWDRQTWIAKGWQEAFNGNVRIAMEHYNQSGVRGRGLHTFQYMYGCQLRADGSTGGFRQYGYDGRDFLSYDTRTPTWVAPSKEAEITKGKMDADRRLSQQQRDYLERKCVEWLQKYLGYGKETLQRRERPAMRVTGRDAPGGPTTLCCRAHGFYPRDIALSWLRKGESREQETWRGGVLPNGDGTYHAWATVELDPRERGLYRCHVEQPPSCSALLPALIGAVAVTALLAGGTVEFVLWRRRCSGKTGAGYTPAQASDKESSKGSSSGSDSGCDTGSLGSEATSVGETSRHPEAQQLLPMGVPAPLDDGDPPAAGVIPGVSPPPWPLTVHVTWTESLTLSLCLGAQAPGVTLGCLAGEKYLFVRSRIRSPPPPLINCPVE
ncbi:major histocompatibility complex class I-related gene protein-like isoform X2 [Gopherus evgoodei]|uniref:major histocompatibility complex class I-related gene protein-like isoform X2 n=1 Tax=Gopherus evgoodei TaxID=1825980 RepID=UPI0011CEE83B|nr:major histocompatibility complex class I-related gene protein-like isoform X2 [Gopherus evgoodei]